MVFNPDIMVPVVPNPMVESTFIILDPIDTFSNDLVFGTITKSFATSADSS